MPPLTTAIGSYPKRYSNPVRDWFSDPNMDIKDALEAYEQLKKLVEDAADDVAKAEGGNKAAGTRVRKAMQEIKKVAQELRVGILGARS